jgi:LuxR family transcriptional regulator, maltose regulon positive regulatory protein
MTQQTRTSPDVRAPLPAAVGPLRAKLRIPSPGAHTIVRTRLHEALDRAIEAPLVMVIGPAGSGKTTLLASWVATSPLRTAWLTLDERDHFPQRFWESVIAAMELLEPGSCDDARAVAADSERQDEVLDRLVAGLHRLHEHNASPALLIVDDVQMLDDGHLEQHLAGLVQHLPHWLHVVLASRREPHVPLDRLRASGHVSELRFADLSFSNEEARELLTLLVPDAAASWVDETVGLVQGWAAGLQLSALAARAAETAVVAEASTDLGALTEHYLVNEVLGSETDDMVDALRALAVVDRFNIELAQELTRRVDADSLVRDAMERGLFVFRCASPGWFRLHPVARGVLLELLAGETPALAAELHARAAVWHAGRDDVPVALEHWVLAGNRHVDALHLLAERVIDLYDAGRADVIERTIAAIPQSSVAMDFAASEEYAWCHLLLNEDRFVDLVDRLTWWAERSPPPLPLVARLTLLRSVSAALTGDWTAAGSFARRAMDELGGEWPLDGRGRFAFNMMAREIAFTEAWDDAADVVRDIDRALAFDPASRLAFEGIRAIGLALSGRPLEALQVVAGVRRAVDVTNMTVLRHEVALAEAVANREFGDRDRATAELTTLAATTHAPLTYVRTIALTELACAQLEAGDLGAARATLAAGAASFARHSFDGPHTRSLVARTAAQIALAGGDLDEASEQAARIEDAFWRPVMATRIQLARAQRLAAHETLDDVVGRCPRHEVVLNLLRARAAARAEDAEKCTVFAIEVATSSGMLQSVAVEGAETIELVERCAWRAPGPWIDRLRRGAVASSGAVLDSTIGTGEALTERERDVLRFLPSRLTLREIAQELYISPNTLKFHLKVIYRKLGVSSRQEAAEIARGLTSIRPR